MPLVDASKMAEYKAFYRAVVSSRPPPERLFYDPYAEAFLSPGLKFLLWLLRQPLLYPLINWCMEKRYPGRFATTAACTRLVDDLIMSCIDRHQVKQVVILGAGYDCRAHRLPAAAVQFVEVDYPQRQTLKRQVLQRIPHPPMTLVDYIPMDLATQMPDDVLPLQLKRAHYNSLFIWEDIHRAFTGNNSDKMFGYFQRFPEGTRFIFTYAAKNPGMFIDAMPVARLLQQHPNDRNYDQEPARFRDFLEAYDLQLEQFTGADAYRQLYYGKRANRMKGYEWYNVAMASVKVKTIES